MSGSSRCLALLLTLTAALAAAPAARATVTPTSSAQTLADAIRSPNTTITAASFVTRPPSGYPTSTSNAALGKMPTAGGSTPFAILSSGNSSVAATTPPLSVQDPSRQLGDLGVPLRGDGHRDVTVLKLDVTAGPGSNCLTFDFQFLSQEFPSFVNGKYNDAFIAELDTSSWKTTADGTISAPDNFAFDASGKPISVNAQGALGLSQANAAGTEFGVANYYGGATPALSASKVLTPGAHALYLSIFDMGDDIFDSAAFVDNLRVGYVPDPVKNCKAGAQPVQFNVDVTPAQGTKPVGAPQQFTAKVRDSGGQPVSGATVRFNVTGANTKNAVTTTDASGDASFSYAGAVDGDDTVSACYDLAGDGSCAGSGSATITWVGGTLGAAPATIKEGDDGTQDLTFALKLSKPSTFASSVTVTTAGSSAASGSDFSPVATKVSFPPGTTERTVSVPIVGDRVDELDEQFDVRLSDPVAMTLGATKSVVGTITDDDTATIAVEDLALPEGTGGTTTAAVPVRLSTPSDRPVTVEAATEDLSAVAPEDYAARSAVLTFAPGTTTATLAVPIEADAQVEQDEAFLVRLGQASAAMTKAAGLVRISNDDVVPAPPAAAASAPEESTLLRCTGRSIVLTSAELAGASVRVAGVTLRRFAGQRVTVLADGKAAGATTAGADGTFSVNVPAPAAARRAKIRYSAQVGGRTATPIQLSRGLTITKRTLSATSLTITGRLASVRAAKRTLTIQRSLGCGAPEVMGTTRTSPTGTFRVTLPRPDAGAAAVVYRLRTRTGGRTFTVPILVPAKG